MGKDLLGGLLDVVVVFVVGISALEQGIEQQQIARNSDGDGA